ncbi:MAG: NlpC/P60 family protein [Owenweeksia sp.]|nr:NlpC/P60 family protein [Owenweeksia sp.]
MGKKHLALSPFIAGLSLLTLTGCGGGQSLNKHNSAPEERAPRLEHDLLGHTAKPSAPEPEEKVRLTKRRGALYQFIEKWEGTPHRMGGNTLRGVDCSGFVIQAYLQVYQRKFAGRRAEDLFGETKPVNREKLHEGDLVFFKIKGRRINHVGIYLENDNFVHVSASRGVMVSNLNEAYFKKYFLRAGVMNNSNVFIKKILTTYQLSIFLVWPYYSAFRAVKRKTLPLLPRLTPPRHRCLSENLRA